MIVTKVARNKQTEPQNNRKTEEQMEGRKLSEVSAELRVRWTKGDKQDEGSNHEMIWSSKKELEFFTGARVHRVTEELF